MNELSHFRIRSTSLYDAYSTNLRLWPGIIIVSLQWLFWFIIPIIIPTAMVYGVFGGLLGGLAIVVWWVFFSRSHRIERWGAILLMIAALSGTYFLLDKSIATANMGLMFIMYSIPVMSLAFVIWTVASYRLHVIPYRLTMIITIILTSGLWIFLRTDGMDGDGHHDLAWRWAKTDEDRLLEQSGNESSVFRSPDANAGLNTDWPGFRGPNRDGIVHGVRIKTDWAASPPVEMWRKPIGPGCSSFAAHGNFIYTQEQLGEYEIVSCYNLANGNPVWKHRDKARFYDSHAGAGPRSTPTLAGDRIYTLGGTGIINALNSSDGTVIWSRNAANDAGVKVLTWGFSGSPLVVSDIVIVALAGKLAAYDIFTGEPRWYGPDGGSGYSSPHLLTISGVPQVLLMSESGALSVKPENGEILWNYSWSIEDRILQPAYIENGDLLLSREYKAIRRISLSQGNNGWTIKDRWTSSEMKLFFNDCVIHKGYAYGFDGPIIACIDLKDGSCMWRGNHYRGWLLLLAEQDILLILSEKGELSHFPAIKGKTWNHPILVGNIMVIRNAREMAAFKLP